MTDEQRFDIVTYRLDSAKRLLPEIEDHISHGYYNTAMNRMYYACFYAVSALLVHHEIPQSPRAHQYDRHIGVSSKRITSYCWQASSIHICNVNSAK